MDQLARGERRRQMMNRLAMTALVLCVTASAEERERVSVSTVEMAQASAPVTAKAAYGDFDGDGCMDFGLKSGDGSWYIDVCQNGYGGAWDAVHFMYGDASVTPVPADYDGDGKTDLAIKDTSGMWAIDYAANGFGAFDAQHHGYGYADAVPVPADYDGDGKADLAVKDAGGMWGIDWAANGFIGWDDQKWGYGDAAWKAVPANYDGDVGPGGKPRADRAVKTNAGEWKIDYSNNGYRGEICVRGRCFWTQWDVQLTGYGPADAVPGTRRLRSRRLRGPRHQGLHALAHRSPEHRLRLMGRSASVHRRIPDHRDPGQVQSQPLRPVA